VEKYSDLSWCSVAYGMNLVYHFVILQSVALVSMSNITNIMININIEKEGSEVQRL